MYNIVIDEKQKLIVGKEAIFESCSLNDNNYSVVFEDDGNTGYFYALNSNYKNPIQEALHIYNVENVVDKDIPSELIIAWSKNGNKSILFINNYPHATLDFDNKSGQCRTGFPPRNKSSVWSINGHEWNEEIFNEILYGKK